MKNIVYTVLTDLGLKHGSVSEVWDAALTSIREDKFPKYEKLFSSACAIVVGARQE